MKDLSKLKNQKLIETYYTAFNKLYSSLNGLSIEDAVRKVENGTEDFVKRQAGSQFIFGSLILGIVFFAYGLYLMFQDGMNDKSVPLVISGGFLVVHAIKSFELNMRFAYVSRLHGMHRILSASVLKEFKETYDDPLEFDKDLATFNLKILTAMSEAREEK